MTERKVKCLICGSLETEETIEFHLESLANHYDILNERGLFNCFEYLDETENLSGDYYYPYYGYVKRKKKGYQGKEYYYVCTLHEDKVPLFENVDDVIEHCLKEHSENPDTEGILKHRIKEAIVHNLRVMRGSTENISTEDLERYADEEIKKGRIEKELTGKEHSEALQGYILDKYEKLSLFMTHQNSLCPLCNHDIEFMGLSQVELYITKKALESLKSGMNLSEEDRKDYDKVIHQKYGGQILDKKVSLCLKCLLHLHTSHPTMLENLVKEGIVKSALTDYLVYKGYEKEKTEENLSSILSKDLIPYKDRNVKKEDKALRKELEGDNRE